MPIVYICKICKSRESVQVLINDRGQKRLMPPYRWCAVTFEAANGDPDVLCPACSALYEDAEPKTTKKALCPFVVMDGGKP